MAHNKLNLSDYLPYLVNRVGAALVARFTAEALDAHRLSIAMWRVLVVLADRGPLRQIDIAASTSIDVSTLSRLVTRLVQSGLATRVRSESSNREVTIGLTPKAERLIDRLVPLARDLERSAMAAIPAGELAAAKAALRRMHQNLGSSLPPPSGKRARKTPR